MQTVLITGANRGIGLELTRRYKAAGDRVLACCREPAQATALQALAKASPNVTVYGVRVSDGASVAALAAQIGDQPVDLLINNAGMAGPPIQKQSLEEMDFDGWAEAFAVNTMAPLRMLQTFRKNLAAGKNPRAVTITSQMGAIVGGPNAEITPEASAAGIASVIANASIASTGKFMKWNGEEHPW